MNMVIGIEGYVGAGKTAICKELLNKIPNSILLDGGSLYRAIVYSLMQSGLNLETLKQQIKAMDIKQIMEKLKVQVAIENRNTVIYVDGKIMEEEDLQSTNSSIAVSELGTIANNQNLYLFGRSLIDEFKQKFNVIVSGRDLMAIYPNLDYHFLITASLEERIRRKSIKYHEKVDLEELKQNIQKRDELQEKAGYYKKYEKTIVVDVTNCKTVEDSTNEVLKYKNTMTIIPITFFFIYFSGEKIQINVIASGITPKTAPKTNGNPPTVPTRLWALNISHLSTPKPNGFSIIALIAIPIPAIL